MAKSTASRKTIHAPEINDWISTFFRDIQSTLTRPDYIEARDARRAYHDNLVRIERYLKSGTWGEGSGQRKIRLKPHDKESALMCVRGLQMYVLGLDAIEHVREGLPFPLGIHDAHRAGRAEEERRNLEAYIHAAYSSIRDREETMYVLSEK